MEMVEVRDGHAEKQAAMSAHNYFADFAIPVEAAFDAGWDAALTTAAAEADALRERVAVLEGAFTWLQSHIAEVDDDNSYWGGPHKREYLSAPEILRHMAALKEPKP